MGSEVGAPSPEQRDPWALRLILPWLGIVGFGLAVALLTPEALHRLLVSEYGPVELGTAAGFAVAGVLALGLAVRTRARVPARFRILYVLFALGALFAALEEISYGQHFLGWQSPPWFVEQNAQRETNLHNLFGDKPGRTLRNAALVGVALGGIVLPATALWAGGQYAPGRLAYYLLPRAQLVPVVAAILLMRLVRTLPRGLRAGWDLGLFELMELYMAGAALLYVMVLRRRLLSARATGDG
jgi:hypothetical protein